MVGIYHCNLVLNELLCLHQLQIPAAFISMKVGEGVKKIGIIKGVFKFDFI